MENKTNDEKNLAHVQKDTIPELETLKDWWKAHGDKISYVLIAICAIVIGYQQYGKWRAKSAAEDYTEYSAANSSEKLEQFIAKNKSSDYSALARLRLGQINYTEGKYAAAKEVYEAFLKYNPRHPQADIAKIGVAFCAEAMGDFDEAANRFKKFAGENLDSYLAPQARIGLGRSLILAGKKEEGKQVLDLFITESPSTQWAILANEVMHNRNRLTAPKMDNQFNLNTFFDAPVDTVKEVKKEANNEVKEEAKEEETPAVETPAQEETVKETPAE